MSTERIHWRDVERAARNLVDAWEMAGGPMPPPIHIKGADVPIPRPMLAVDRGNVSQGHAGELRWLPSSDARLPGSSRLPRRASDAYDDVTARTGALHALAAARREEHRALVERARAWKVERAALGERADLGDEPSADEWSYSGDDAAALVDELLAALTEGWPT